MENNNLIKKRRTINWGRYILALIITASIFGSIFYVSNLADQKRLSEVKSVQDTLSIDLLSSETQFSLLSQAGCTQDGNTILAPEIGEMGDRLSYMEEQLGTNNADVLALKKYYSLLQIKDYLLVSALSQKCHTKPVTILYFYSNDCADCTNQGYVLTSLRAKYPDLRVYSFDTDLNLSAIDTLEKINVVSATRPSLVIDGITYSGYQSIDAIEKILKPQLKRLIATPVSSSTDSTTAASATSSSSSAE